ncbi:OmpA family protein [Paraflavitalea sp. CAU 1676]|uniref:OmpA family protein n=1 Tax=Paraflavitalea sp. CAU 1676 TaxID=3032598 RepID=UPI0023D9F026|nr:OmpA family protein [Paraflavitalea sp. CAU 1676]MDF2190350.1 OmpA family protein [Paraflavitalea sp. CAU 1676]
MKKLILLVLVGLPLMACCQLGAYSRYDFIPGDNILYLEDFAGDAVGELPLKWVSNNRGETVTVERMPGKWFRLFPGSRFASPAFKKLPASFTMEADLMLKFSGEGGYVYPEVEIKLLELLAGDANVNSYVVNQDALNEVALVLMPAGEGKPLSVSLKSYVKGSTHFSNAPKEIKAVTDNGGVLHLSVWVQQQRVRYWINGEKIFDIPLGVPSKVGINRTGFSVESSLYTEDQLGIFVSNLKLAEGTPDMRSKLLTEGRLVTNGILFDVDADRIKPESAGVLKELAAVLKENPTLKVKIIGHTDSDGDVQKNLDLSRRRSVAVQNSLVKDYGIEEGRLQTEGKGESAPIADNNTAAGKAKNRRVEFVRL